MVDQTPYRTDKYVVTRTDGQPVGRTFVIEIDKDPDAKAILDRIAIVYDETRPELAKSLRFVAHELEPKR